MPTRDPKELMLLIANEMGLDNITPEVEAEYVNRISGEIDYIYDSTRDA